MDYLMEHLSWAVTFIPMPMPKTVCRTYLWNIIVQQEVCRTYSGRGMGMNRYEYHSSYHVLFCWLGLPPCPQISRFAKVVHQPVVQTDKVKKHLMPPNLRLLQRCTRRGVRRKASIYILCVYIYIYLLFYRSLYVHIYIYIYIYVYIVLCVYIYIYIYVFVLSLSLTLSLSLSLYIYISIYAHVHTPCSEALASRKLGAKDCTPEINTSEIIVDFQWISQWTFSGTLSNITSLVSCVFQRIVTFPVDFHWNCPMDFQWHFSNGISLVISGV